MGLVLKYLSVPLEPHRGVEFVSECYPCRQTVRGPQCMLCKRLCMHCSICRIVVKGSQFLFGLRSRRSQSAHGALVRRRKCLSHWMWMPLPLGEFLSAVGLNYHQCREGKKTYLTMYIVKYACCDLLLMFCKNIDAHYPK